MRKNAFQRGQKFSSGVWSSEEGGSDASDPSYRFEAPVVNFKPLTEAELNAFVEADQLFAQLP